MTVSATAPIITYDCTGGTSYTYGYKIFEDSDLTVVYNDGSGNETDLTLDVDYTVSGAGDGSGGTITTNTVYNSGTIQIYRNLPYTQEHDLQNQGPLDAETLEEMMDRVVMLVQQIYSQALGGVDFSVALQIKSLYESNADTNEFSDAEQTKLLGIETDADVTDTVNVDAAGAVMDTDFAADGLLSRSGGEGSYTVVDPSTYLTDASADGTHYARKDGAWETFIPALMWEVAP